MKITLFGKQIKTYKDIEQAIIDEIEDNMDCYCDDYSIVPLFETIDDIDEFCCDEFETDKEYEQFKQILKKGEDEFEEIYFDIGDSMYMMSGGGFSSWSDYYQYRLG